MGSAPSEWSYMFDTTTLEAQGTVVVLSPTEEERKSLIKRLGVIDLRNTIADVALTPDTGGTIHVQGIIKATVVQECVTTFAPVTTEIQDDFDAWFADPEAVISFAKARQDKSAKGGERPILSEQEDPEAIVDGKIDLGECVTQFLSLALPAYPHAEGVEPMGDDPDGFKPEGQKNPFAALKNWKDRQR